VARLVFLGRLEDVAGAAEMTVAGGPLAEVLAALPADLGFALSGERIRIAYNGTLVSGNGGIVLGDRDEIAFLPPVSGG